MQIFKSATEHVDYADKCLRAGLDPEFVAFHMGFGNTASMVTAIQKSKATAGSCKRRHMIAMLRAAHASRLMRKGLTPKQAAAKCGYAYVRSMRRAIRRYEKSPAPTGIGNGALTK